MSEGGCEGGMFQTLRTTVYSQVGREMERPRETERKIEIETEREREEKSVLGISSLKVSESQR